MSLQPSDERFLHRALILASDAAALASPNPTVGCVLARGEDVLGEGAHIYDNFDHAEIAALKQAASLDHSVVGATAYVTLEPCAHHGRTGPCADALIAAGIARCVVAAIDPNPLTRNKGLAKMRDAGIIVDVVNRSSPLAAEARTLNDAFAHFIQHRRPFVTLKAALSVDGKLAPTPASRTSTSPHWLTGEAARADVQKLRHASDAILTGIGTVLADNPALTDRTGLPRRRPLLRVVLDANLRTPAASNLLQPSDVSQSVNSTGAQRSGETPVFAAAKPALTAPDKPLIFCAETAPQDRIAALQHAGAEVLPIATTTNGLDLAAVLAELGARNILSVLLETGSTLNGAFLHANLVDKLVLYYAESELGLDALPFAAGQPSPYVLQQQLTQTTRTTFPHGGSEDIRIAGYLHDPWNAPELRRI